MVDYMEILRLSSDPKNSQRCIASIVHSSRHTIRDVLEAAKKAGVSWPLDDTVTNEMLKRILFPEKTTAETLYTQPDYPYIHKELARPGVNLTLLWTEYCRRCENDGTTPYMYTQFCEKYRQWARITKATMRIQHKPGDAMQVDWAGNTLDIYDPVTGDVSKAYLFVAVLPCSCYAYAEACDDMKLENWLLCHAHAYSYFGGVTRLLIPDNLKTGVAKNTRYETVLNRSYQELAEHYDTAIVPARVEHPKPLAESDKAEKSFVSGHILELDRRYVIADGECTAEHMLRIPMKQFNSELIGFTPLDNIRMKKQGGGMNYVHGGISLQESVVPVIEFKNIRSTSKKYVDVKKAELQLISQSRKVSNSIFSLDFYQKEAVSGKVAAATYEIYMTDASGRAVSDKKTVIADKTSNNGSDRVFRARFTLKSVEFKKTDTYYLTIVEKGTTNEMDRIEFTIDIAFVNDFDF